MQVVAARVEEVGHLKQNTMILFQNAPFVAFVINSHAGIFSLIMLKMTYGSLI